MDASFTTNVTIVPLQEPLGYNQQWLSLGSCFSDNIGQQLQQAGFSIELNPFGVLFNPRSISMAIRRLLSGNQIDSNELFQSGSLWNHFGFSNLHSGTEREQTVVKLNNILQSAADRLKQTKVLVLTFGTSWVYQDFESQVVVANCHKLPAARFTRRRLTVEEIVSDYTDLLQELPSELKIIFTVSPVRHWKEGAHDNTLSKSVLHLAVEALCKQYSNAVYFPAYELVIDELRDYRFYNQDMVHPSDTAILHVWRRFMNFAFTEETRAIIAEVGKYQLMANHRSIHPDSEEARAFIRQTENVRLTLLQKHPEIKI